MDTEERSLQERGYKVEEKIELSVCKSCVKDTICEKEESYGVLGCLSHLTRENLQWLQDKEAKKERREAEKKL